MPGDPTTVTWATSGWLSAHASSPSPVAIAVESPVTTMRTGRESPSAAAGRRRVDGRRRRGRRRRGRRRRSWCGPCSARRRRAWSARRWRRSWSWTSWRSSRSSTTESTGASVAALASSPACIQYGVVSSGTTATTSASDEHAASAGQRRPGAAPPARIGAFEEAERQRRRAPASAAMRTANSSALGRPVRCSSSTTYTGQW